MKSAACLALLFGILAPRLLAQTDTDSRAQQPLQVQVTSAVAQKLLIRKADLICPHTGMPARVTGTVVVDIQIGKNGDVVFAKAISGPVLLRKPARDSIRKYKYTPYFLNGQPVSVETTVSVTIDSYRDCKPQ